MHDSPDPVGDALAASSTALLRAAVTGLVAGDPPARLIGGLLREAVGLTGARVGVVFALDRRTDRPNVEAIVHLGRVVDIDAEPVHRVWRQLADSEGSGRILERLRGGPSLSPMERIRATLWAPALPWHDAMGYRFLFMVPVAYGGRVVGALGLGFDDAPPGDPVARWPLDALMHPLSLVLVQAAAAADAREAARDAERRAAADLRAAELARSARAMQRVIDAMASLGDLDAVVPATLVAAAEAFDIETAGYFEHLEERIHLRFWLHEGRVLGPDELPALGDHLALVRDMAAGFVVPPEHLGEDIVLRRGPVVIDHATATASPALHRFACERGWRHEINVPLMVDGRAEGVLALFRPADRPFGDDDVALAVLLSRQLALAMQGASLARRARHLALAAERNRLAADIHDSLAQSLTSIALQAEVLAEQFAEGSAERRTADLIERTARRGLAEARASVQALRALPEDEQALGDALAELAEHCTVRGSIDCRFEQRAGRCPLGPVARDTALRVAQEAVNNAMKHSGCRTLRLRLDWDENEVVLTVRDDGRGLTASPRDRAGDGGGYGLAGMAQRAVAAGGRCRVDSAPGRGTTVRLHLPRGPG